MAQLRVIIVDDNKAKRDALAGILPDYFETIAVGAAEKSTDYLKPDAEGNLPDLVILNGDDPKNIGLYVFDWMINKSGNDDIASIPVIVLTQDEFSDKALEFLEIGDVTFYEGDVEDTELFSVINDAIEEAEFMSEPLITSYEETKNLDRLIGHSVKAPGDGRQRSLVIDMDNRMANLEAALERGKKRVTDIRDLLDAAQKLKETGSERRKRNRERDAKENAEYVKRMSTFLKKAREKNDREEQLIAQMREQMQPKMEHKLSAQVIKKEQQVDEPASPKPVMDLSPMDVSATLGDLKAKAVNNPMSAYYAQGMKKMEERPKSKEQAAPRFSSDKRTVVIADDDLKTRKLCSLFLTQKYNVVTFDSGMKTIDYFVRNRADLLIINAKIGGMSGITTVTSVHMQPGNANIPIMFIVGEDYEDSRSNLLGREVVGILNKPIKQSVIAAAVDGYFDSRGRLF